MRFKNRYILLEIKSRNTLETALENSSDFLAALREEINDACGSIGYAKVFSSLRIIYYNMKANYIILRVSRDYFRLLKRSLFLMTSIKDIEVKFRILFTTGTIRSAEKKLFLFLKENEHSGLKAVF